MHDGEPTPIAGNTTWLFGGPVIVDTVNGKKYRLVSTLGVPSLVEVQEGG